MLATFPQKLAGGEPSVAELSVNVVDVDAVVPVPFDTATANVAPESPLTAGMAS